jgi:hypothetical protein
MNEESCWVTQCQQKFVRKENSGKIMGPVFSTCIDRLLKNQQLYRVTSSFFTLRKYFEGAMPRVVPRYGGLYGRISHTNLKTRMVIFRLATSKNHIELLVLVPSQI